MRAEMRHDVPVHLRVVGGYVPCGVQPEPDAAARQHQESDDRYRQQFRPRRGSRGPFFRLPAAAAAASPLSLEFLVRFPRSWFP